MKSENVSSGICKQRRVVFFSLFICSFITFKPRLTISSPTPPVVFITDRCKAVFFVAFRFCGDFLLLVAGLFV